MKEKVSVIGDGGWGTTLGILLAEKNYDVTLWSYDPGYAEVLQITRENKKYFPGFKIPESIKITSDIDVATDNKNFIILAVPSKFFREVVKKIKNFNRNAIFISVAKGIEIETFKRMSEIIIEEHGEVNIAVLSGPSIAYEVALKKPTSVVVASYDENIASKVQALFFSSYFRVYTSSDVVGVELGGALKNIIAIAAGICDGLGFGTNSKSALLSRGLAELIRLGKFLGADPHTFFGLSGMGDMITTCFSTKSRNRWVGEEIGKGKKLNEILDKMEMVAEGIYTVRAVNKFIKVYNIDMPISQKVYEVLYENKPPDVAVQELMAREPKSERLII
jgi:glycerol-3-phosphate dehydrogenase (NAD(P)+)